MSNIIEFNGDTSAILELNKEGVKNGINLAEMTEDMLIDVRKEIANTNTFSMPITELSLLGAGVSSLVPALRTVTQTTTFNHVIYWTMFVALILVGGLKVLLNQMKIEKGWK